MLLEATTVILVGTAIAHSVLGERFILTRLFRQELPPLFGDDRFTKHTLRMAWHLTTVAWLGLVAVLWMPRMVTETPGPGAYQDVLFVTLVASMIVSIIFARGRHLSWVAFAAAAVLVYFMP